MTEENNNKPNGWKEWGNHVLQTLDRLEGKITNIEKQQHNFELDYQREITRLKTKSAIWGAVTGIIGSIIISIVISFSASFILGETRDHMKDKYYHNSTSFNESIYSTKWKSGISHSCKVLNKTRNFKIIKSSKWS